MQAKYRRPWKLESELCRYACDLRLGCTTFIDVSFLADIHGCFIFG